jgi:dTDP-4-dehydrorhamnose reductase
MTVLVTGGAGQLAMSLSALAPARGIEVVRVGRPAFDFDQPASIASVFREVTPKLVINAAAYTAVDAAENDAEAAHRANVDGPRLLAELCAASGAKLIHVSTDYVYDGSKGAPYVESDATAPLGVYGATKLAGEQAVAASLPGATIVRTSWVYSATGKNFVKTMLGAARKTDKLRVVGDQRGCPTASDPLAEALLVVAGKLLGGWDDSYAGVFHACGGGETTWHGLAVAAFEEASAFGLRKPEVAAIRTEDWPTPVKRPADSRLDCGKLARVFGAALPEWRESLRPVVARLMEAA